MCKQRSGVSQNLTAESLRTPSLKHGFFTLKLGGSTGSWPEPCHWACKVPKHACDLLWWPAVFNMFCNSPFTPAGPERPKPGTPSGTIRKSRTTSVWFDVRSPWNKQTKWYFYVLLYYIYIYTSFSNTYRLILRMTMCKIV